MKYRLSGKTFRLAKEIKHFGGRWDAKTKVWVVGKDCLDYLEKYYGKEVIPNTLADSARKRAFENIKVEII